jgi:transcriptional regulator with XRE-family HTH domain
MSGVEFRDRLAQELGKRRQVNPRYSLRAFASFLGANHSTVSQVLRGKRRIRVALLRQWGQRLGLTAEEVAAYVAVEHVPDATITKRQEELRHWTAEALAIMKDQTHWQIVRISRMPGFRPDCRWVAKQLGVSTDAVNMALSRLLRLRLLKIETPHRWRVSVGCGAVSEAEFRKYALIRVRELAADYGVKLGRAARKPATGGTISNG